jgi:hypothetical protein
MALRHKFKSTGAFLPGNTDREAELCKCGVMLGAHSRENSYSPPFSGSRPQTNYEFEMIHDRWIDTLIANPPAGIPEDEYSSAREGYWPETWADFEGGRPIRWLPTGDQCTQCGFCRYYIEITSKMGSDWGVCSNPDSQYDRTAVFEHWTCKDFGP